MQNFYAALSGDSAIRTTKLNFLTRMTQVRRSDIKSLPSQLGWSNWSR